MFQFTFDKDGKVFDATLPMVSGVERNVSSGKYLKCIRCYVVKRIKLNEIQRNLFNP